MSFWEKIQEDMKKNIHEGIAALKEGSATVSKKIELLTEEGKRKYQVYTLHMKVKDEFSRLGGMIYDLTVKKAKNPMSNRNVTTITSKIRKLEAQIKKLEGKTSKKTPRKTPRKAAVKSSEKRPKS